MNKPARTAVWVLLAAFATPALCETLPKWLVEAQARELRLPAATAVASEDGWLQTRVPGTVRNKVQRDDDVYALQIALGSELEVSCEVVRGARDLADLIAKTAEFSFGELKKQHGEIEARAVEAIDAGAVDAFPYLSLRWLYRVSRDGEVRLGALKQFAADLGDVVVYCAQDDLGYVQTFDAVAKALVAALRIEGRPVDPGFFRELSVVRIGGQRVGFASTAMARDADGDTQILNKSTLVVQRAPGQLMTQDGLEVQWVRPDGSLISAVQAKVGDGKLSENLRLARDGDEAWTARGTLAGKEVEFKLPEAPSSFVALARARRDLMARPDAVGASTEARTWSSLDLSRLLPSKATVVGTVGANAYAVREEVGGVVIDMVLDRRTGTMASARLPVGPLVLDIERIVQLGSP